MHKINAFSLITYVYQYLNPEGTAEIIKKLNMLYDLKIDTDDLIERDKEIKNRVLDLADKAHHYHKNQLGEAKEANKYSQLYQ